MGLINAAHRQKNNSEMQQEHADMKNKQREIEWDIDQSGIKIKFWRE